VLHAGGKTETYRTRFCIEPIANQNHIAFVNDNGEELDEHLTYKKGEVVYLSLSELERLEKSEEVGKAQIAKDLLRIIKENPNRLLHDERNHILRPLGIKTELQCKGLFHYRPSGRLSIGYTATTETVRDALRWSLISPPNHSRKMSAVVKFVEARPNAVDEVRKQIVADGLGIHPVWEEYGI